ncbi:hypothetical protein [Nocardioides piscis]|uniref:Uncharacterized protein n=1 Tax=Nocardioides piscis TaxID=2714938 RepID=A0A6G7YBI4_9ACTN|nr:hypothetical protein [Nocardioides piscis]QIK74264.1 hypothetical protein G7071_01230 [Nocardioides piscis]
MTQVTVPSVQGLVGDRPQVPIGRAAPHSWAFDVPGATPTQQPVAPPLCRRHRQRVGALHHSKGGATVHPTTNAAAGA